MNFFANLFGGDNANNQRPRSRRSAPPPGRRNNGNNSSNHSRTRPAASSPSPQQQQQQSRSTQQPQQPQQQQEQQPQQNQRHGNNTEPEVHTFHIPPGMEHIFANLFNQAGFPMPDGFTAQFANDENASPNAPPPASENALRTLPIVKVTPEDLVDENNRECCICFEAHNLGDKVVRLPCAHICKLCDVLV